MPVIPTLERQRRIIASPRPAWATSRDPVSKNRWIDRKIDR
jgi:hypothetical protein